MFYSFAEREVSVPSADNGKAEREALASRFKSSSLDAYDYRSPNETYLTSPPPQNCFVSHVPNESYLTSPPPLYGFSALVLNVTNLKFYDRVVLFHSEYQELIQGLLLLAVFTTSGFSVLAHLLKFNKSKKQVLVLVIILAPFVNTVSLLIGCYCDGDLLTFLEGFQEMYLHLSVLAMGRLVLLNVRFPKRLDKRKTLVLKILLWQALILRCIGTVFQIVFDLSSYEFMFCCIYGVSSVMSGLSVLFLYYMGGTSNLESASSKMSFTKLFDVFVILDIYLRYKKVQHSLRASISMLEMVFTGFVLFWCFPAKRYAKRFRGALRRIRNARKTPPQLLPV